MHNLPVFIWSNKLKSVDNYRLKIQEILTEKGMPLEWEEVLLEDFQEETNINLLSSSAQLLVNNRIYDLVKNKIEKQHKKSFRLAFYLRKLISICSVLLFVLFPKCPFCWAAYISIFSGLGLNTIEFKGWFIFVPLTFMLTTSIFIFKYFKNRTIEALLYLSGILLIVLNYFIIEYSVVTIIGIILMFVSSVEFILPQDYIKTIKYYGHKLKKAL